MCDGCIVGYCFVPGNGSPMSTDVVLVLVVGVAVVVLRFSKY